MAKMNGNIGTVSVTVEVELKASDEFDAVAKMLGYVKKRTCRFDHIEGTWYKTACGERHDGVVPPNYCPNCGGKVVS